MKRLFLIALTLASGMAVADFEQDKTNWINGAIGHLGYSEIKTAGCAAQDGGFMQCRIHAYKGAKLDIYTILCGPRDGCRQIGLPKEVAL